MEDFVTIEIAKKLKEKGYPQSSSYYYAEDGGICIPVCNFVNEDMPEVAAPQIHEVLKWLREQMGIDVLAQRGHINRNNKKEVTRYYCVNVYFVDRFVCTIDNDEQDYPTYEEAALAGIEYVLDNVI